MRVYVSDAFIIGVVLDFDRMNDSGWGLYGICISLFICLMGFKLLFIVFKFFILVLCSIQPGSYLRSMFMSC